MTLRLQGLEVAPPQVCGAFRLVPLLRTRPCGDVRLQVHGLDRDGEDPDGWSFVPHGLIVDWSDGDSVATMGGQVRRRGEGGSAWTGARHKRGASRREGRTTLRFLPLQMALDGLLALHFGRPRIAWKELSTDAFGGSGLAERYETSVVGRSIAGFEDAVRTFEVHERQVGVLVFVADALASVFVVPAAADYRRLHRTLLDRFYGQLVSQYALLYPTPPSDLLPELANARDLAGLRTALTGVREQWDRATRELLLADLMAPDRSLRTERVLEAGPLLLERFVTDLDPARENHIGERLVRGDGEILYLETYRLSAAQTRRAHLLAQLAANAWHLAETARSLRTTEPDLVARIEKAGFGALLRKGVRMTAAHSHGERGR